MKQEWTTTWRNFVPDICGSARENQAKCENALNILKLLSEEVFDFSKNTLLAQQASKLKANMTSDFGAIFELCNWVLEQAAGNPGVVKPSLVRSCLKTLQSFLSWMPYGYIFDTPLIETILNNFVLPATTRVESIKCFTEVASLDLKDVEPGEVRRFQEKMCLFFCIFVQRVAEVTKQRSLEEEYQNVVQAKQQTGFETFCKQVALAISAVLKGNLTVIEETTNVAEANQNIEFLRQCTHKALEVMTQLSNIPEDELFKICLDFWHFFTYDILMKTKGNQYFDQGTLSSSSVITLLMCE